MFYRIHNSNNIYEIMCFTLYQTWSIGEVDRALSWHARSPMFKQRVEPFFNFFFIKIYHILLPYYVLFMK